MTLDLDAAMGRALELAAAAAGVGRHPDRRRRPGAGRRRARRGGQRAGEARRPHRARRGAGAAGRGAGARRRLAADRRTLVVTLEPCTMCAGASVLARVARVVYGADDPKAGAAGSLWDVVRDRRLNHRPEVTGGVRAEESATLLRAFFRDSAGPVVSSAVACPSGRRSTPRKRVRATPSVGSNPTATASQIDERRRPSRTPPFLSVGLDSRCPGCSWPSCTMNVNVCCAVSSEPSV